MRIINTFLIVLLVLAALASVSLFTVNQYELGLVSRLGRFITDKDGAPKVYQPGLNIRMPFIDKVHRFDTRLRIKDVAFSQVMTSEQKQLMVDLFIEWQIEDPALFYKRTFGGQALHAENLLAQKLENDIREAFGKRTIKEVVSGERLQIMESLRKSMDEKNQDLGISVVDVRIKKIELPAEVSNAIFDRMRSEREQVASKLRAQGDAIANEIRATADKEVRVQLAEAKKQADTLRGEGESKAVSIYANSYSKAPQFFEFYRSLEAYKHAFNNKQDMLVLSPNSEFFKYFNQTASEQN